MLLAKFYCITLINLFIRVVWDKVVSKEALGTLQVVAGRFKTFSFSLSDQ